MNIRRYIICVKIKLVFHLYNSCSYEITFVRTYRNRFNIFRTSKFKHSMRIFFILTYAEKFFRIIIYFERRPASAVPVLPFDFLNLYIFWVKVCKINVGHYNFIMFPRHICVSLYLNKLHIYAHFNHSTFFSQSFFAFDRKIAINSILLLKRIKIHNGKFRIARKQRI